MDFWRSIGGMMELELTSSDPGELLNLFNENGIVLFSLSFQNELTCRFHIRRQKYAQIQKICGAKSADIKLVKKPGIYWKTKRIAYRPVLLAGFAIMVGLILFLPTRVFFLEVTGNETVPVNRILEAAQNCGICFGASRREVRSERVKNALIDAIPQLQWAGVNTRGCVAVISVRERSLQPEQAEEYPFSSLIAVRDGYVLSATATRGNLLVQPGQSVEAGQTLVSGYHDLGLCIKVTNAEGEVFAQTNRELTAVTPAKWEKQLENGSQMKKISLLLGKKRINLWKDSGISDATCGRMYEEYYVTLPGGFSLPVAICVESFKPYKTEQIFLEEPLPDGRMEAYLREYLLDQTVAGEIRGVLSHRILTENLSVLRESYTCHEMIARQRQEQIGDIHE